MSAFTPGPWVILREPGGMWITRADKSFAIASIPPMAENADADARLIAAAPALLEALEALLTEAEDLVFATGGGSSDVMRDARAAIKAARGEA